MRWKYIPLAFSCPVTAAVSQITCTCDKIEYGSWWADFKQNFTMPIFCCHVKEAKLQIHTLKATSCIARLAYRRNKAWVCLCRFCSVNASFIKMEVKSIFRKLLFNKKKVLLATGHLHSKVKYYIGNLSCGSFLIKARRCNWIMKIQLLQWTPVKRQKFLQEKRHFYCKQTGTNSTNTEVNPWIINTEPKQYFRKIWISVLILYQYLYISII